MVSNSSPLTNTLNIRLSDAHKRALEAIAEDRQVSVSEVARQAIQQEIEMDFTYESFIQAARETSAKSEANQ